MNAIEQLTRDHRDLEDIFDRLSVTDEDAARAELVERLATLLTVHTMLEEQHFYPAARTSQTDELIGSFYDDHEEVKRLTGQLLRLQVDDEAFSEHVDRLRAELEKHVLQEEQVLFPLASRALPPDLLESLADEMQATRDAAAGLEPRDELFPEESPLGST